jgi:acetyl-CoA C-acetyltransferase
MPDAFIYDALRTPRSRGSANGVLNEVKPVDLLVTCLHALEKRMGSVSNLVNDTLIGCVTPIDDQGYNIAKVALLHAGWKAVSGMQINRYCTSGLEAVNIAAVKIRSGWEQLLIAGGVESMSRVPMGSDGGALLYDPQVITNVNYLPQGVAADLIASLEGFSREELDMVSFQSQFRAINAQKEGYFDQSIIPIYDRNGLLILDKDNYIRKSTTEASLAELSPAFLKMGEAGFDQMALQRYPHLEKIQHLHTAGSSSGIVDGASLVLIGNKEIGQQLDKSPRAKIVSAATVAVDPTAMLTGPTPATQKALHQVGMTPADIDLWECNEAFAAVSLKFQRDLDIDPEKLNVNGGAIALGHPLGATGAMLLGTLLDELERRDLSTGVVTLCAGGGMGVATVIERV